MQKARHVAAAAAAAAASILLVKQIFMTLLHCL
jgi:hypothetical protein